MTVSFRGLAPLCLCAAALAAQPAMAQTPAVQTTPDVPQLGLMALGLNVADLERSLKFYVEGLGLKPLRRNERGDTIEQFLGYTAMPAPPVLELIAPKQPGVRPVPPTTVSFKIVMSVNDAVALGERLTRAGFSVPPVRVNPQTGFGVFFVRDPDGYNIEIVQRPAITPAQR